MVSERNSCVQKSSLYKKYKKEKNALAEIDIIKKNVDMLLGDHQRGEQKRTHQIE